MSKRKTNQQKFDKNYILDFLLNKKGSLIYQRIRKLPVDLLDSINNQTSFLKNASIDERIFCIYNDITEKKVCKNCNKNKSIFFRFNKGYSEFCSHTCSLEFNNNNGAYEKMQQTLEEKYKVKNASQIKVVREKVKKTNLKKYGREYYINDKKVKESGMLDKYNVTHPSKSKEIIKKKKKEFLKKYGVETNLQLPEAVTKAKENSLASRKKATSTVLRKYYEIIKEEGNFLPMFPEDSYLGKNNSHKFQCKKCEKIFEHNLYNGPSSICCPHCYTETISKGQSELWTFVSSFDFDIVNNDKKSIKPKELDITVKEKGVSIEYNGLYWHSSDSKEKDLFYKYYHRNKTEEAAKAGFRLFHIFEDEWLDVKKKEVWKSILRNAFMLTERKIYARKCVFSIVSGKERESFFEENHLKGDQKGKCFGLYFKNELVMAITIGKSRFSKKEKQIEILRSASKKNTNVIGGFSKLIKIIKENYKCRIISYADLRYSSGVSYENCGFEKVKISDPGYFYVKGRVRENRMKFQKHKLKNSLKKFDPNLTEVENMYANKYRRIWDCGNIVYVLN